MFYQRLSDLCKSKGTSITAVLKELNISSSKGTAWKNGSTPNMEIVKKLADYFDVTTDYLINGENKSDDERVKFALFGTPDVPDDIYKQVKDFAKYLKEKKGE